MNYDDDDDDDLDRDITTVNFKQNNTDAVQM